MIRLPFVWPFKSKQADFKYSELEMACLNSFNRGIELGIVLASEIDEKIKTQVRNNAMNETVERLRANDKKNN